MRIASLYKAFPAPEAHPKSSSLRTVLHTTQWQLARALQRQNSVFCPASAKIRRIATLLGTRSLKSMHGKNSETRQSRLVIWQFSTADARIKLKHLYPVFESDDTPEANAPF